VGNAKFVEFDAGFENPLRVEGDATDTSVLAALAHSRTYEPEIVGLFHALLTPDDVVLDVGANIGLLSIVAARLCPRGHVYAFEPSSHHREFLRRNVDRNATGNVTVVPYAVLDVAGVVELSRPETYQAGSFIAPGVREGTVEPVGAIALDDWAEEHGLDRCDVVKLDIEGSERLALRGARRLLARFAPILLVECNAVTLRRFRHEGVEPLFRDLLAYGGACYAVRPDGALEPLRSAAQLDRLVTARGLVDVLCVPRSRRSRVRARRRSKRAARRADLWARLRSNRWHAPPDALVHDPSYRIDVRHKALDVRVGDEVRLPITIHNTGRFWLSDQYAPHCATASYRWVRAGAIVDGVGGPRTSIGALRPGTRRRLELTIVVDREPGRYELDIGVVQEDFAWLVDLAPHTRCRVPVIVRGPVSSSTDPSTFPSRGRGPAS
jgi:FkbM family methyltransferase